MKRYWGSLSPEQQQWAWQAIQWHAAVPAQEGGAAAPGAGGSPPKGNPKGDPKGKGKGAEEGMAAIAKRARSSWKRAINKTLKSNTDKRVLDSGGAQSAADQLLGKARAAAATGWQPARAAADVPGIDLCSVARPS